VTAHSLIGRHVQWDTTHEAFLRHSDRMAGWRGAYGNKHHPDDEDVPEPAPEYPPDVSFGIIIDIEFVQNDGYSNWHVLVEGTDGMLMPFLLSSGDLRLVPGK
jgi:hypothetical protein